MRVRIPFRESFREAMLTGQKNMTSRTRWFGHVGDEFIKFGEVFVITELFMLKLENVARLYYKEEGCSSQAEFILIWGLIHPKMGYLPDRLVYCHKFERKSSEMLPKKLSGGFTNRI